MTTIDVVKKPEYPVHLESDVVLRNGRTLRIRPVRPDDRDGALDLFRRLSPESLYTRFFDVRTPEAALQYSPVDVDYRNDFGVVGEVGGRIMAMAHYFRGRKQLVDSAEVAFTIADEVQGLGIGTRMLDKLAEAALPNGIVKFQAEVLAENTKMLDVFLNSGFAVTHKTSEGCVHVSFPIEPTEASEEAAAYRSRMAAHASMAKIFEPRSIAVVGASRRRGQLGAEVLHNLRSSGYKGSLYPVNPKAGDIDGLKAYASLRDVKGTVDLAIVIVPTEEVEHVVDDCVAKGVAAIVVISAGFAETGDEGRVRERRLVEKCRAAGIRLVGPNCMGVINTDPTIGMHGTFTSVYPPRGSVAMSSQSGALGLAILDYARQLGIGFSTFISVGNKADVSGNDLIQYWAEDPNTDVMLLYLESFGNPRKFGEIARRVARKKPIVAVKAGRSATGARAASSHTGALAQSDAITGDLFRQAGIIRTDTLEELFDVASLFARQPKPPGRRVAIMTNAGGPAILAADACEANGLTLPHLAAETVAELRSFLPAAAAVGNPVDMIASATPEQYRRTLNLLLADPNIDAVVVIYIPVFAVDAAEIAAVISRGAENAHGKTLVATFMSARPGSSIAIGSVPAFPFPERAVTALARVANYADWRRRPAGVARHFDDLDTAGMRATIDGALARGDGWLSPAEVKSLLEAARIQVVRGELAVSEADAVRIASRVGYPVVLKVDGPDIIHKSEVRGVKLSIPDEAGVREAWHDFTDRLGDRMTGALVQHMVTSGVEVMAGAIDEATFGQVIVYGAGGVLVELLSDVAFRLQPLSDVDAHDLINEVRYSKLLHGYRGAPPSDIAALEETLLRLSSLIHVCPEIRELDINPLKVMERGVIAVDARVKVAKAVPQAPSRRIAY
ncbi:MAG TPA: GNAT family N-acetyltransferase [Thermoanaerobaculia bacterium]|nr:GNAT family N-acetyltransferase [Thermoanaerobaculia bacterium]